MPRPLSGSPSGQDAPTLISTPHLLETRGAPPPKASSTWEVWRAAASSRNTIPRMQCSHYWREKKGISCISRVVWRFLSTESATKSKESDRETIRSSYRTSTPEMANRRAIFPWVLTARGIVIRVLESCAGLGCLAGAGAPVPRGGLRPSGSSRAQQGDPATPAQADPIFVLSQTGQFCSWYSL